MTVAFDDSRVDWWGPLKYAWRMRAMQQAEKKPILLQCSGGGHFGGNELAEKAEQVAFVVTHATSGTRAHASDL